MGDFQFLFLLHVLFSVLWNVYPGPTVPLPLFLSLWFYSCRRESCFTVNTRSLSKRYFQICKSVSWCVCVYRLIKCLLTLVCRDAYYRKSAAVPCIYIEVFTSLIMPLTAIYSVYILLIMNLKHYLFQKLCSLVNACHLFVFTDLVVPLSLSLILWLQMIIFPRQ